jgi:hypothetical protein
MNFGVLTVPCSETTHRIVNKLRQCCLLLDKGTELKCQVFTEEKLNEIAARFEHSPWKSLRHLAQEITVSRSLVQTAM